MEGRNWQSATGGENIRLGERRRNRMRRTLEVNRMADGEIWGGGYYYFTRIVRNIGSSPRAV